MTKRMIFPLILGVAGVGILLWLGAWQMQRLEWKQAFLSQIEARISHQPIALPTNPNEQSDKFLAVSIQGHFDGAEIHVLASRKNIGAGYKVVSAFITTTGRRLLVDRGFIPIAAKHFDRTSEIISLTGNLHWPDEIDKYTPTPDTAANIWFARDVGAMAVHLGTEPLLIQASTDTGNGVEAFPVNTTSFPNDHLEYAITWFLLAGVWFVMTLYLLWRIKRQPN